MKQVLLQLSAASTAETEASIAAASTAETTGRIVQRVPQLSIFS